jgi:hypothetical protein
MAVGFDFQNSCLATVKVSIARCESLCMFACVCVRARTHACVSVFYQSFIGVGILYNQKILHGCFVPQWFPLRSNKTLYAAVMLAGVA